MAIEVLTPPSYRFADVDNISVFLAGAIDMGSAVDWQSQVIDEAADYFDNTNITFYNPRRPGKFTGEQTIDNPKFAEQVNWELERIDRCDIFFLHLPADSKAPISLMELGYYLGRIHENPARFSGQRCVISVEEGYYRRGNIEVILNREGMTLYPDLTDALRSLEEQVNDLHKDTFI
jgi:hypothetical protein